MDALLVAKQLFYPNRDNLRRKYDDPNVELRLRAFAHAMPGIELMRRELSGLQGDFEADEGVGPHTLRPHWAFVIESEAVLDG